LKKFWASLRCSDVFFVFGSQDLPSPKRRLKAACPRQIYKHNAKPRQEYARQWRRVIQKTSE
jgi:hypothetical protein